MQGRSQDKSVQGVQLGISNSGQLCTNLSITEVVLDYYSLVMGYYSLGYRGTRCYSSMWAEMLWEGPSNEAQHSHVSKRKLS